MMTASEEELGGRTEQSLNLVCVCVLGMRQFSVCMYSRVPCLVVFVCACCYVFHLCPWMCVPWEVLSHGEKEGSRSSVVKGTGWNLRNFLPLEVSYATSRCRHTHTHTHTHTHGFVVSLSLCCNGDSGRPWEVCLCPSGDHFLCASC